MNYPKCLFAIFCLLVTKLIVSGQKEIAELSLEELGAVPMVRSEKDSSRLFDSPINSHIFGEEALTYLPVDSIPELLRYAPGVHVVRPTSGNWGVGIHGMNSKWFSRVPFTVDDQNVDASAFSGLFGSQHDLLFSDIASVEVVYGPGGILWPNNGGNGSINVVMKTAFETQGSYVQAKLGSKNRQLEGRSGWAINEESAVRVYGKYSNRKESDERSDFDDSWETGRVGARYDFKWSSDDLLSISADIHGSNLGYQAREPRSQDDLNNGITPLYADEEKFAGVNIQGKWLRQISDDEGYSLRTWASFTDLEAPYADFDQTVLGLEARSRTPLRDGSELVFTGGIIGNWVNLDDNFTVTFMSDNEPDTVAHFGAQWTKPIFDETIDLIAALSGRYETLGETFEPSPMLSILFKPTQRDRVWISYTRSAHSLNSLGAYGESIKGRSNPFPSPSPLGPVQNFHFYGISNDELDNEVIQRVELGYRRQYDSGSEFGASVFYNAYEDIWGYAYESTEIRNLPSFIDPFAQPYAEIRAGLDNVADADAYGFDTYVTWVLSSRWKATFSYSYLSETFDDLRHSDLLDPLAAQTNEFYHVIVSENSPENIASLWIVGDFNEHWRGDLGFRYTEGYGSELTSLQDSIFQMDASLTWRPSEALSISLVGRNLMETKTEDDTLKDNIGDTTPLEREWYLELTYSF